MRKIVISVAIAALAGLAGCEQNTKPAQRQADRLENEADRIEKQGDRAENTFDKKADALRDKADVIEDGITYEVAKVDKQAGRVTLTRKDLGEPGVNSNAADRAKDEPEMKMQSGKDLTISFVELETYVAGEKKGAEIADELHEGENVTVFMDANGKVTKLDY